MTTERKSVGKVLRLLRKQQNFSQETLAAKSGLDRSYLSLLERGKYSPSVDVVLIICQTLNLKITDFASKLELELGLAKNDGEPT